MSQFKGVETLRQGDADGNRMVVRLDTTQGKRIHAIGVPQDTASRTGPTWAYLFDNQGLTLIDAGATGSYNLLADGIQAAGFAVGDVERVIITHGHQDHDGAAGLLAQAADAEIWAHDIYGHLLQFNPWDIQRNPSSPLQNEMQRVIQADGDAEGEAGRRSAEYRQRHKRYVETRRAFQVSRNVAANETQGELTFLYAPGHSPDEICITLDGLVFTGDHVLPEITPHPTTKTRFSADVRSSLPDHLHATEHDCYGLETYLRSLKLIADLGEGVTVLPAHRLFSKNRFNFETTQRAGEILEHHAVRLGRILQRLGDAPTSLEAITRGVFARRKLIGGNLYMALSEIVAHIELLEDVDDIEIGEDVRLRSTGSDNYKQLIHELAL